MSVFFKDPSRSASINKSKSLDALYILFISRYAKIHHKVLPNAEAEIILRKSTPFNGGCMFDFDEFESTKLIEFYLSMSSFNCSFQVKYSA